MKLIFRLIQVVLISVILFGCDEQDSENPVYNGNDTEDDTYIITDRSGKEWDVTHAVENYGFETNSFQFGLGPNAIKPINNPVMISQGEPGYPSDNSTEPVIGLEVDGDERAYSIQVLTGHEVVNDRVGGKDVAVVY